MERRESSPSQLTDVIFLIADASRLCGLFPSIRKKLRRRNPISRQEESRICHIIIHAEALSGFPRSQSDAEKLPQFVNWVQRNSFFFGKAKRFLSLLHNASQNESRLEGKLFRASPLIANFRMRFVRQFVTPKLWLSINRKGEHFCLLLD